MNTVLSVPCTSWTGNPWQHCPTMLLLLIPPVAVVRARNGPYSGPVPPTYGYDATSAGLQRPAWAKPRRDAAAASAFGDARANVNQFLVARMTAHHLGHALATTEQREMEGGRSSEQ